MVELEKIKQFAFFQTEGSSYDGFALVRVTDKNNEPCDNPWIDFHGNVLNNDQAISAIGSKAFTEFIEKASVLLSFVDNYLK